MPEQTLTGSQVFVEQTRGTQQLNLTEVGSTAVPRLSSKDFANNLTKYLTKDFAKDLIRILEYPVASGHLGITTNFQQLTFCMKQYKKNKKTITIK